VLHVVACANNVALTVIVPAGSNRATISWFRAGGPANCGERMGYKVAALKVPSIYRPRIQTRRLGSLAGRIGECGLRCSPRKKNPLLPVPPCLRIVTEWYASSQSQGRNLVATSRNITVQQQSAGCKVNVAVY